VKSAKLSLGVGTALLAFVCALTLTRAPSRVLRTGTPKVTRGPATTGDTRVCQSGEVLPAGASAVRLSVMAYLGSRVRVKLLAGGRVLADGQRGPDWTGTSVTVPVTPRSRTASNVKLCVRFGPTSETLFLSGAPASGRSAARWENGRSLGGRVGVEYLGSAGGSWWSRILTVARHVGLGRAIGGTWIALVIAVLIASVGFLAVRVVLREWTRSQPGEAPDPAIELEGHGEDRQSAPARNRPNKPRLLGRAFGRVHLMFRALPTAALACALIAFLNAAAWSLLVPPFQGKDEADHFSYVAQIVQNGALPVGTQQAEAGRFSPREELVLHSLHASEVTHSPQTPTITTSAEQRDVVATASSGVSPRGAGGSGVATPEPPLYYLLQAVPYALGGGNTLVELQLMRLLGAFLGAATALLTFLFLRESLPATPWAAAVGALCIALQPLLAFVSGSVNPDSLLFTIVAATLLCLARAFRRGLTVRLVFALGLLIAAGFMTKLNFMGFALGIFTGLAVLAVRAVRAKNGGDVRLLALGAFMGIVPVAFYFLRNQVSSGGVSGRMHGIFTHSFVDEGSYVWQMYFPRLPGMTHYFVGMTTLRDVWFDRFVGLYGWMDTTFPVWVDTVALGPVVVIAVLCARELYLRRAVVRRRFAELCIYLVMLVGVMAMIGLSSYLSDAIERSAAFGEPRYLLPFLPLGGVILALAVRGAGRAATVVGVGMMVLFFGHDLLSMLQVTARYYG
jgi:hypothetical protein